MTSPSPDTDLVERLRTDADKGSKEIATFERVSAKHASQLIANSLEAASRIEALTAQQQEPVGEVEINELHKRIYLAETNRDDWRERAEAAEARISTLEAQMAEAREIAAWQWSDFSGKWYTPDTARLPLHQQEALARMAASDHGGRVRPLYAPLNKDETGGAG